MRTLEDLFEQGIKESLKKFGERPAYFLVGGEVKPLVYLKVWQEEVHYRRPKNNFGTYKGVPILPSSYIGKNEVKAVVSI